MSKRRLLASSVFASVAFITLRRLRKLRLLCPLRCVRSTALNHGPLDLEGRGWAEWKPRSSSLHRHQTEVLDVWRQWRANESDAFVGIWLATYLDVVDALHQTAWRMAKCYVDATGCTRPATIRRRRRWRGGRGGTGRGRVVGRRLVDEASELDRARVPSARRDIAVRQLDSCLQTTYDTLSPNRHVYQRRLQPIARASLLRPPAARTAVILSYGLLNYGLHLYIKITI